MPCKKKKKTIAKNVFILKWGGISGDSKKVYRTKKTAMETLFICPYHMQKESDDIEGYVWMEGGTELFFSIRKKLLYI